MITCWRSGFSSLITPLTWKICRLPETIRHSGGLFADCSRHERASPASNVAATQRDIFDRTIQPLFRRKATDGKKRSTSLGWNSGGRSGRQCQGWLVGVPADLPPGVCHDLVHRQPAENL